jgi:hypothetical protein
MENALKIKEWIEKALAKFTKELSEPYVGAWKPDDADPTKPDPELPQATGSRQSSHSYGVGLDIKPISDTSSHRSYTYTINPPISSFSFL